MKEHIIEVFILDTDNYTKYISSIRRYSEESIGVIKTKIQEQKAVLICKYTKEPERLEELYELLNNLKQKGATLKILQNARNEMINEIDLTIILNLIERRKGIVKEVEEIMDLEVGE